MIHDGEKLREFGSIGAGHAATALASLFDRVVWMEPPKGRTLHVSELPIDLFPSGVEVAGVAVDLSGVVKGVAALLISSSDAGVFLRLLPGRSLGSLPEPRAMSALAEVGNIALCAAAGALAKLAEGVVMPSVPRLAVGRAEGVLSRLLDPVLRELPAYLVETDLVVREEPLRVRFVWVPVP